MSTVATTLDGYLKNANIGRAFSVLGIPSMPVFKDTEFVLIYSSYAKRTGLTWFWASVRKVLEDNLVVAYLWGEIAQQLGKESLFKAYWESGPKAPDETAWLNLFADPEPILILLDEMPPYFHYYSTQVLGQGTVADIITRAFSNMLTAASKKKNVCIVVSDLEAAYDTGGKLIQAALDDATQELGRAEISITPVNLESSEIYEIIRKRLFLTLPDKGEIADIASVYASRLAEAAKAKSVDRSAESLANEIEMTYPFHPSFKSIVALFKENEKFKQTRGLMELVSRLLKSVWQGRCQKQRYPAGGGHRCGL